MTSVGEHHAVDRAGAHAGGERLEVHRAVQAEQAADAEQREAEAELDAGAELGGDDDQQREALAPSGIVVVMMPIALTARKPAKTSSSAPAYSPLSESM